MPATQLQVAMGIPLDRMPQIRNFYGLSEKDLLGWGKGASGPGMIERSGLLVVKSLEHFGTMSIASALLITITYYILLCLPFWKNHLTVHTQQIFHKK